MILAIDFDGTIHDHLNPIPGRHMGEPIEGAKEALEAFKRRKDTIIIFSVNRVPVIKAWMLYWKIPFDDITNTKPDADYYIDDKAITFTSWNNIKL